MRVTVPLDDDRGLSARLVGRPLGGAAVCGSSVAVAPETNGLFKRFSVPLGYHVVQDRVHGGTDEV